MNGFFLLEVDSDKAQCEVEPPFSCVSSAYGQITALLCNEDDSMVPESLEAEAEEHGILYSVSAGRLTTGRDIATALRLYKEAEARGEDGNRRIFRWLNR